MTTTQPRRPRDDSGASLIAALAFIAVISLMVGLLTPWMTNQISSNVKFANASATQTDLANAANVAIQSIRYAPLISPGQTLNASPPSYCWGAVGPSNFSGVSGTPVSAWCSTQWTPLSNATRVVTIDVCTSSMSAAACAAAPQLQVVVTFNDYLPGNLPTNSVCTTMCGEGITIDSWTWNSK